MDVLAHTFVWRGTGGGSSGKSRKTNHPYHGATEVLAAVRGVIADTPIEAKVPMTAIKMAAHLENELGMERWMAQRLFSQIRRGAALHHEWHQAFEEERFVPIGKCYSSSSCQTSALPETLLQSSEPPGVLENGPHLLLESTKESGAFTTRDFMLSELEVFRIFNDSADSLGMGTHVLLPFIKHFSPSSSHAIAARLLCQRWTETRHTLTAKLTIASSLLFTEQRFFILARLSPLW